MMESKVSPEAVEAWRGWIGRTESRRETIDPEAVRRYAAAMGADLEVERTPPPLAHWGAFLPVAAASALGPDGHPQRGGFLPPVDLPRRMWAAGSFSFHRPLMLGREAERVSTIADVSHRSGKTGDLVFVELEHAVSQDGAACVVERQTLVYRHAGQPLVAVAATEGPDPGDEVWTPSTVDLFRFSAATFNGHRIHYDQSYTREVEGYPDLVVHGPLTAARLCGYAAGGAGRPLKTFAFRALAPLFVNQPVRLRRGGAEGEVQAVRCDGTVAVAGTAGV
jgi:3-methylfumaryl-CoA hydratase